MFRRRFNAIFGSRSESGDPVTANQVVLDYCRMFPTGEEKTTKLRGKVQLTTYIATTGTRNVKRQRRTRRKMDYEAFVTAMQLHRQWDAGKSDRKWKELDCPANFADDDGPAPHHRRLRIPTNLLCTDESQSDIENYEDRALQVRGQDIKNADLDTKANLQREMSQGFAMDLARPTSASAFESLPSCAVTLSSESQKSGASSSLLTAAYARVSGVKDETASAGAGGMVPAIVKVEPVDGLAPKQSPQKGGQNALFDLRSSQTSFTRSANGTLQGLQTKVAAAASKAATSVRAYIEGNSHCGDDEFTDVSERLEVCMLWMSMEPGKGRDSEGKDP